MQLFHDFQSTMAVVAVLLITRARALGLRGWIARSGSDRMAPRAAGRRGGSSPLRATAEKRGGAACRWPASAARRRSIFDGRQKIKEMQSGWLRKPLGGSRGLESASLDMGKGGRVTYVASDFFKLIFQIRGSIFDNVLSSECLGKARCFAEQTTSRCSAAQRAGVCSE